MKFTLSWLKDHLETDASVQEISEKLTAIGLEVEEIDDPGAALDGFVVGHVVAADPHPDADRLKLCQVDTGEKIVQVVCGAPNARQGLKVVLAQPGMTVPATGDKLKKGKIRGQESLGMMCSARELGLGEDHDGIIELPETAETGAPAASVLDIDPVIEIAITPNRGDCLGVRGVARDLAAAGVGTLKADPVPEIATAFDARIAVALDFPEEKQACPHFTAREIRGVKNGASPQWLKDRLAAVGINSISVLVDVTNYISQTYGRPLHVFDADKLRGNLAVRFAHNGETLTALDEKQYTLTDAMVVVCDDAGVQGLGGIMGGLETGVTESTTNIVLESAWFCPNTIARTGRDLQIVSDARYRFERTVDPQSSVDGSDRGAAMILELCGGEASHIVQVGTPIASGARIPFRPERVKQLSGVELFPLKMEHILESLGCVIFKDDDQIVVETPSWRPDLTAEHDLIEEIVRIHGYDKIPTVTLPRPAMPDVIVSAEQRQEGFVRRTLAGRGLHETVTWAFMSDKDAAHFCDDAAALALSNPISADLNTMRPSVLPNLIAALAKNAARGEGDGGLFEIGPQFDGINPGEQQQVYAGARSGFSQPRNWLGDRHKVDTFDAKADAMAVLQAAGVATDRLQITRDVPGWYHPGRAGAMCLGRNVLAYFGELHPAVLKALDVKGTVVAFEVFPQAIPGGKGKAKKKNTTRPLLMPSAFMPLERDFAFVIDADVTSAKLMQAVTGAEKKLITAVRIFDVYEGEHLPAGKKSIAISVTLQPTDATLRQEEIEKISEKVVAAVVKATGAELRGQ
jgi:phenylalanyl-tRNA synthetase beta chain